MLAGLTRQSRLVQLPRVRHEGDGYGPRRIHTDGVGGLTLDPVTKTPIVILKDPDNKLNLPIWIGLLEATAMATEIEGIKMARPMTHDLLRAVVLIRSVAWSSRSKSPISGQHVLRGDLPRGRVTQVS